MCVLKLREEWIRRRGKQVYAEYSVSFMWSVRLLKIDCQKQLNDDLSREGEDWSDGFWEDDNDDASLSNSVVTPDLKVSTKWMTSKDMHNGFLVSRAENGEGQINNNVVLTGYD